MKKPKNLIPGMIFLAVSGFVIFFSNLPVLLFPTQEVNSCGDAGTANLTKGYFYVQEATAARDWLVAADLAIHSMQPSVRLSDNMLTVLDSDYRTLYTERFTVENSASLGYQLFIFPKKIHIGKGRRIIFCLSPMTGVKGDKSNDLLPLSKPDGTLGKFSVKEAANNDVPGTLKGGGPDFPMKSTMCLRTYESNSGFFNWSKIFLFFMALLLATLIAFSDEFKQFVARMNFVPEKIYITLALVFGLTMAFITPPLQTPDESSHFYRSYQISELNVFQYDASVPASLVKTATVLTRVNFMAYMKISLGEILAQRNVELDPSVRIAMELPPYIFPHLPQALGMFIGRQFKASPLTLIYAGRVFNLLFSVILIYFAIRTAPFFKWVFLLLGLMPMTLYLCASLAKDAMIFGLSFWLVACFLRCAYGEGNGVRARDLAGLFVLVFFTVAGRSVYIMIAGLFILIPVHRIGSLKRYIIVFACLMLTAYAATQVWSLRPLFKPSSSAPAATVLPPDTVKPDPDKPNASSAPSPVNPDFEAQKRFILKNPGQYLGILYETFFIRYRTLYLNTFVGRFGSMNKHLPDWQINLYLLVLLTTALLSYRQGVTMGAKGRFVPAGLFVAGLAVIATGMYIGWNTVGQDAVIGIQGRYFIPYAPLFFLALYNQSAERCLRFILPSGGKKQVKSRGGASGKAADAAEGRPDLLCNFGYLLLVCFSVISLLSAVYVDLALDYRVLF